LGADQSKESNTLYPEGRQPLQNLLEVLQASEALWELLRASKALRQVIQASEHFTKMFELVFDNDWGFTQTLLKEENIDSFIRFDRTFLKPGVEDESNNWANRGALLQAYREMREALQSVDPFSGMPNDAGEADRHEQPK
jgi:hypothetical protein